jgi:hypothetical protein
MVAPGAVHVVTATILLNGGMTLRAIFGVGQDVVGGLRVISTLDQPLSVALAVSWQVIGLPTLEAECGYWTQSLVLLTHNGAYIHVQCTLHTHVYTYTGLASIVYWQNIPSVL